MNIGSLSCIEGEQIRQKWCVWDRNSAQ